MNRTAIMSCAFGSLFGLVAAAERPIVVRIGFTESESGTSQSPSQQQVEALRLWIANINASSAIELSGRTFLVFETVS